MYQKHLLQHFWFTSSITETGSILKLQYSGLTNFFIPRALEYKVYSLVEYNILILWVYCNSQGNEQEIWSTVFTWIYCWALCSKAKVVAFWCSGGDGTNSFRSSRQSRRWARLTKETSTIEEIWWIWKHLTIYTNENPSLHFRIVV